MRFVSNDAGATQAEGSVKSNGKHPAAFQKSVDLIPLYDHEQFLFLVERERARADRAAARPPKASRHRAAKAAHAPHAAPAAAAEPKKGQPKPSSEGVWGATTDNREFSLAIFRPQSRTDRAGLVELLQCCVRTTDAVGVVDARRLGVLLPDTAAQNAQLFVSKVLAAAKEQGVHLNHIVHTYPNAWPDEESPKWHEPKRSKHDEADEHSTAAQAVQHLARKSTQEGGLMRGLVNWLQSAAQRKTARRAVRAPA
jgi:hypothetical protein